MLAKLREDYHTIFKTAWPVMAGGVAIGIINVLLFTFYQPWTTLDGVLNWGQNLGLDPSASPLSVFQRSGSVINFGLLFGAFLSALLAGQFGIRIGPGRELLKGLIGGLLIGVGAALVRGCNIGGFFSGTSAFGGHGLMMAVGLAAGAFVGSRYLVWEMNNASASGSDAGVRFSEKTQMFMGIAAVLIFIYGFFYFLANPDIPADRSVIFLFGGILGIVSQRSRICFVRAFREPFLTGEASHTKAMLMALFISISGFAVVKFVLFEKVDEFVRPTFWQGSLIGGLIFGFGMVLAGGCGGGTIWRVGEGHVKLWLTLVGYIYAATKMDVWLRETGLLSDGTLGGSLFMPEWFNGDWGWTLVFLFAIILIWYLLVHVNEESGAVAAFK